MEMDAIERRSSVVQMVRQRNRDANPLASGPWKMREVAYLDCSADMHCHATFTAGRAAFAREVGHLHTGQGDDRDPVAAYFLAAIPEFIRLEGLVLQNDRASIHLFNTGKRIGYLVVTEGQASIYDRYRCPTQCTIEVRQANGSPFGRIEVGRIVGSTGSLVIKTRRGHRLPVSLHRDYTLSEFARILGNLLLLPFCLYLRRQMFPVDKDYAISPMAPEMSCEDDLLYFATVTALRSICYYGLAFR